MEKASTIKGCAAPIAPKKTNPTSSRQREEEVNRPSGEVYAVKGACVKHGTEMWKKRIGESKNAGVTPNLWREERRLEKAGTQTGKGNHG